MRAFGSFMPCGSAAEHELVVGRNGDLGVTQIGFCVLEQRGRTPRVAVLRGDDPQCAIGSNVGFALTKNAEPVSFEANQVRKGVMWRGVPDFPNFDDLGGIRRSRDGVSKDYAGDDGGGQDFWSPQPTRCTRRI